jgi:hypothetical protein
MGGSRTRHPQQQQQTPILSRQNSLSMDDILYNDDIYGTPHPTPLRRPVTSKKLYQVH